MYAKIFTQTLDSSIAKDYQVRHVFEDLLKLCDSDGVVDMTPDAIARRTNVPLEIIERGIAELEKPDPMSRCMDHDGRRIVRLDEHRTWGWLIVNYQRYRDIANEDQRKAKNRERVKRFKTRKALESKEVTHGNALVTIASPSPSPSPSVFLGGCKGGKPTVEMFKSRAKEIELPEVEAEKCFDYYESNGWRVGKNPMRSWTAALANWKRHWIEYGRTINNIGNGIRRDGAGTRKPGMMRPGTAEEHKGGW